MAVTVGEIQAVAKLKDEMTPKLAALKTGVAAAAAAMGVMVQRGSEVERIATAFDRLTQAAGQSGDAILSRTSEAVRGLINEYDIMSAANKAALLGLDVTADSMADMASAAVTLGQAMGQEANKSLDDLIIALGRSSPLILDNLGLTVKVGEANKKYAAQLGKTVTQLTDAERKQAFFNAAMDAARIKTQQLGGVQVTAADQYTQLKNAAQNWFDSLAEGTAKTVPAFGIMGGLITDLTKGFNALGPAWLAVGPVIQKAIPKLIAGFRALWVAIAGPAGLVVAIGAVAVALGVMLGKWIKTRREFKDIEGGAKDTTRALLANKDAIREQSKVIDQEFIPAVVEAKKKWTDFGVSIDRTLSQSLRGGLLPVAAETATAINKVGEAAGNSFGFFDKLRLGADNLWASLKNMLSGAVGLGALQGVMEDLGRKAVDWLGGKIKSLAGKAVGWFKGLFGKGEDEAKAAAEEMARAHEEAARKAAEAWQAAMDHASGRIKSAYLSAREAAREAYAATYEAAIAAGLGAAEAAGMASGAQIHAYQQVMAAAKERYLQEVALDAAIKAIREGNAAGAAEAARKALAEASAAFDIMTGAMQDYYTNSGNRAQDAADGFAEAQARMTAAANQTAGAVNGISAAMASIPTHISSTIEITRFTRDVNEVSGSINAGGGGRTFTSGGGLSASAAPRTVASSGDVVLNLDGEVLGRVALKKVQEAARGRAYVS